MEMFKILSTEFLYNVFYSVPFHKRTYKLEVSLTCKIRRDSLLNSSTYLLFPLYILTTDNLFYGAIRAQCYRI